VGFTQATVTHTFTNADGTPAVGTATFTLTDVMTNGTTTITPSAITATLDSTGRLSQALTSNVDTATWQLTCNATAGQFILAYDDGQLPQWTTGIPYNATAPAISAAFASEAVPGGIVTPGILGFTVAVTGGPLGTAPVNIAGVPGAGQFSIDTADSTLTGGFATITQTVPGTVPSIPQNTMWRVDLRIVGASERSFYITVPAGGGTVDLFALLPQAQQVSGG
jgi:hypothetical protein